ncbi:MAG: hypothetical protein WHT82_11090 [Limisphaera sp.]
MAFRIGDAVKRGFLDNREKGRVVGKLWLCGRARPLELDLKGNAHSDLAGRLVHFHSRRLAMPIAGLEDLPDVQRGHAGDLTARRQIEVPDVPLKTLLKWPDHADPPPTRTTFCLYLEWFTPEAGRMVAQVVDFKMRYTRPTWQPTGEDETERKRQVEAAWQAYLSQWDALLEFLDGTVKDPEEEWDEFDYERFLQVCEARGEKYNDLLERYGDTPEGRARIARAMGWEDDSLGADAFEEEAEPDEIEEVSADPDPAREGKDWVRTPEGEILHPLERQWQILCRRIERSFQPQFRYDGLLLRPETLALLVQCRVTAGRLRAALRGVALGEPDLEGSLIVACLKRALHSLHDSHRFFQLAASSGRLSAARTARLQKDLFRLREAILHLMQEYRHR